MKRIKWFFELCGMCLSMCWRGYWGYMGWSAFVHAIGLIVGYLGDYTVLYTMIRNFPGIGELNANEICFLYAMGLTSYALGNVHTRRFWEIDNIVQRGELDQYLVRPVSPLLQLFVWDIQVGYVSHLILGIGSMLFVKNLLGLSWTLKYWLVFVSSILSGGVIMGGISVIATPLTFWWGRSDSVVMFLRQGLRETIKYPLSVYPGFFRRILYIIPYAFVNYLPCLYLFNKSDAWFIQYVPLLAMMAGIAINIAFWVFWRMGLKRYNSAGG